MDGILEFVRANPYLFGNLFVLASVSLLSLLASNRDYKRAAVFSGLACLPCALAESTSGAYWHPVLLGGKSIGVESFVFTFASGFTVWLTAAWWRRNRCTAGIGSFKAGIFQLMPWTLTMTAVYVCLWLAGMNCVTATLVTSAGLLLYLLARRASLWRLALAGLVTFTPLYMLEIKLQFAAWPTYISYWNPGGLWGTLVLGIPRGEIAWAAMFGAAYPVVIASALDVRFDRARTQAQRGGSHFSDSSAQGESLTPNSIRD
jgi:hypothetical protein